MDKNKTQTITRPSPLTCPVQELSVSGSRYRLVATDIDGTLIDRGGLVSVENLAAIEALRECGVAFTLVTGRTDRQARIYVKQLQVRLPIIACNGAVIRDCATDQVIASTPVGIKDVMVLHDYLSRQGHDYICYTPDTVYYPAGSRRIELFVQYNRLQEQHGEQPITLLPLTDKVLADSAEDFVKMLAVLPDPEKMDALRRLLQEKTTCVGEQSGDVVVDIMKAGVSKGRALQLLADRLHIAMDQVVALGDQENDISMLRVAGLGVAMGNAMPAVKAAADVVTLDHEQSGVAQAIRQHVLPQCANG
ncbi:MAG: HAD family hydrolase [Ruminococcaceae bacterium]|nr:HAD family hydrolase [Oscillospiraceae bacterium]